MAQHHSIRIFFRHVPQNCVVLSKTYTRKGQGCTEYLRREHCSGSTDAAMVDHLLIFNEISFHHSDREVDGSNLIKTIL